MSDLKRHRGLSFFAAILAAASAAALVGCGEPSIESNETFLGTMERPLYEARTLYYEGSCAWLAACANGDPYCGGSHTCSDSTKWVARPSTAYPICNDTVYICRLDNPCHCITAKVWDTSCCGAWEGNRAVFNRLGQPCGDGNPNTCSYGWGQVDVAIMGYYRYRDWRRFHHCDY